MNRRMMRLNIMNLMLLCRASGILTCCNLEPVQHSINYIGFDAATTEIDGKSIDSIVNYMLKIRGIDLKFPNTEEAFFDICDRIQKGPYGKIQLMSVTSIRKKGEYMEKVPESNEKEIDIKIRVWRIDDNIAICVEMIKKEILWYERRKSTDIKRMKYILTPINIEDIIVDLSDKPERNLNPNER